MAKTIKEHRQEMTATFDQWYATDDDVATIVDGFKMVMDFYELNKESQALILEGVGLVAGRAFGAGSIHGSKLAMELTADKFKILSKKG